MYCLALRFATSIFTAYKRIVYPNLLSVVVVQEMMSGAKDDAEIRDWMATAKKYEKEKLLLVPTAEDWVQAGRFSTHFLEG